MKKALMSLFLILYMLRVVDAEPFKMLSLERAADPRDGPTPQFFIVPFCVAVTVVAVGLTAVYVVYSCGKKLESTNAPPPPPTLRGTKVTQGTETSEPVGSYPIAIEWTTNLIDWQVAGVVMGTIADFQFYHTNTAAKAFYRAVIY